jgi:hypothetical protein
MGEGPGIRQRVADCALNVERAGATQVALFEWRSDGLCKGGHTLGRRPVRRRRSALMTERRTHPCSAAHRFAAATRSWPTPRLRAELEVTRAVM